jgi:hypothetical protein
MNLLLEKRGEEIKITEEVVMAGAGNEQSGKVLTYLLLNNRSDIELKSSNDWIQGLQTIGYTIKEITGLLYERAHDSPWIYFQPADIPPCRILQNHLLDGCVHPLVSSFASGHKQHPGQWPASQGKQDRDVRRSIEELCGLGGVSPSRDASRWNGMVQFKEQNSVALLSHSLVIPSQNGIGDVVSRLVRVAEGFLTAARTVQNAGFCCDSYTILRHSSTYESGLSSQIQLVRVEFSSALRILELLESFAKLHKDGADLHLGLRELQDASWRILGRAIPSFHGISEHSTDVLRHSLHISSLAIQFLCVSFLSYRQAHTGSLGPFFLDTPLGRVVLLSVETVATANIHITANLVQLSYLDDIAQGPALVFNVSTSLNSPLASCANDRAV